MYVDRRLAGVQAVQTLSRLNRAYPGKEFTYVIDFVNSSEEILKAFKQYHTTAELEAVTDPELALDLRNKLDDAGHYDDFEVDRVVEVEMNPKSTQGQLIAALEPVADRILKAYKAAQTARQVAEEKKDNKARDEAQDTLGALLLFKGDMVAFIRLYAFLSQVIDYGNTDIEKRFIFFHRLLPLLEFGREREGVDLSKVVLTHHNLKSLGKQTMLPGEGEIPKLPPSGETGTGGLSDKEKLLLSEIIAQVNQLFEGEISDDDQLVYVNNVLKGKLLQSEVLVQQAGSNTKEQFSNSPDLKDEIMNAIIDAFASHSAMSKQAIDSERVRDGLKDVLLGPAGLYEALKDRTSRGVEL
jgi:type I restriction enzyme R subunit